MQGLFSQNPLDSQQPLWWTVKRADVGIIRVSDVRVAGDQYRSPWNQSWFGRSVLRRSGSAATGKLIYALRDHWQSPLSQDIATNLYAALAGDTGTFRFSNTTASTLRIASRLVEAGAQPAEIAVHLYENRPYEAIDLMRQALNTLEISADGRAAWLNLTMEMLDGQQWIGQHSEDIIQFPRMIETVQVAMLFREVDQGSTKVSFRSRKDIDVSAIAKQFGGGGHVQLQAAPSMPH